MTADFHVFTHPPESHSEIAMAVGMLSSLAIKDLEAVEDGEVWTVGDLLKIPLKPLVILLGLRLVFDVFLSEGRSRRI